MVKIVNNEGGRTRCKERMKVNKDAVGGAVGRSVCEIPLAS